MYLIFVFLHQMGDGIGDGMGVKFGWCVEERGRKGRENVYGGEARDDDCGVGSVIRE
jgi:hypothetical protein